MKATITVEISGESSVVSQVSVEAPTLEMLKATVTRTVFLQMPELMKHVFEEAAKPPKPKELESAKPEVKKPVKKANKGGNKPGVPGTTPDTVEGAGQTPAGGEPVQQPAPQA